MAMLLDQKAQINMTPMIDILLVLIIIFMVITPLTPRGLHTLVPQPAPPGREEPYQSHDIVLTVRADGTIRLNQEAVDVRTCGNGYYTCSRLRPITLFSCAAKKGWSSVRWRKSSISPTARA